MKRSPKELIRRALEDAVSWQESLADAYSGTPDDPDRRDALELAKQYRAMLQRRYGSSRTAVERALDGARYVTLDELRAEALAKKDEAA